MQMMAVMQQQMMMQQPIMAAGAGGAMMMPVQQPGMMMPMQQPMMMVPMPQATGAATPGAPTRGTAAVGASPDIASVAAPSPEQGTKEGAGPGKEVKPPESA